MTATVKIFFAFALLGAGFGAASLFGPPDLAQDLADSWALSRPPASDDLAPSAHRGQQATWLAPLEELDMPLEDGRERDAVADVTPPRTFQPAIARDAPADPSGSAPRGFDLEEPWRDPWTAPRADEPGASGLVEVRPPVGRPAPFDAPEGASAPSWQRPQDSAWPAPEPAGAPAPEASATLLAVSAAPTGHWPPPSAPPADAWGDNAESGVATATPAGWTRLDKPVAINDAPRKQVSGGLTPVVREREATAGPRTHIVADGDTLPELAERYLGDASRSGEIFDANRNELTHPDLLPLGVELRIPPESGLAPLSGPGGGE